MKVTAEHRLVVSAWSAVSPFGLRTAEFGVGMRAGRSTRAPLEPQQQRRAPVAEACLVPGFVIREVLGTKGTRSMDRVTALAVAAVDQLLCGEEGDRIAGIGDRTALVLGTNTGSAQSIMDFTRDSLQGEKPFFVDPARFPNTVMNCAAGRCAIWHGLRGPNTTIAGGRTTGLLALRYALRLHRAGHTSAVLLGAAEEFSTARAWLDWHSRNGADPRMPLGEGCALLLLEPAAQALAHGRAPLGEVLGLSVGVHHSADEVPSVLAQCVRRVLAAVAVSPDDVAAVVPSQAPEHQDDEQSALRAVFTGRAPEQVAVSELIGDTGAASGAFQLAAAFARFDDGGRLVLLTSVDHDGAAGAALLRLS